MVFCTSQEISWEISCVTRDDISSRLSGTGTAINHVNYKLWFLLPRHCLLHYLKTSIVASLTRYTCGTCMAK